MKLYDIYLGDKEEKDTSFNNSLWLTATVFDEGMALTIAGLLEQIFDLNFEVYERDLTDNPIVNMTIADRP